jgi:hypothetical protein
VPEDWYRECGIDWSQAEQAKKELMNGHFQDFDQGAKDLILKSDPEVISRPLYMLLIGFSWTSKPG